MFYNPADRSWKFSYVYEVEVKN